ncbi:MAG: rod shape-determining protein MreD [Chloroflexota bacterium]
MTFPLLTGVAVIQATLLSRVSVLGARPDLMLLVVLMWAMARGLDEGLVWAFVGGLIIDLLSGGPLAGTALALVAGAYVAGQSLVEGVGSQAVRAVILTVLGALVYHLALLVILGWTGRTVSWGFSLARVAAPSVLLNGVLAPFVLQPIIWLERATGREGLAL